MLYYDEIKISGDEIKINNSILIDDEYDLAFSYVHNDGFSIKTCPFCHKLLATFMYMPHDKKFATYDWANQEQGETAKLKICTYCTFWHWVYEDGVDLNCYGCIKQTWHSAISKTKEYGDVLPEGCLEELAVSLRRNSNLFHSFNPYKLELFVTEVFKANFKNCESIHVGRSDDGGVDVVLIDSGDKQWLIQVKRRERENSSEGVGTVRNLLGAMVLNDSSYGVIVSTANHFTYRAFEAVGRASEKGMHIKLVDKGKLIRMVGALLPDDPWMGFIQVEYPDLFCAFDYKSKLLREKFRPALLLPQMILTS